MMHVNQPREYNHRNSTLYYTLVEPSSIAGASEDTAENMIMVEGQ